MQLDHHVSIRGRTFAFAALKNRIRWKAVCTYKGDEKQRSMKIPSEDVKKSLSVPAAVSIPTSQEKMPLGDAVQKIVCHPYHNSQKAKQSTNKATARNGSIREDLR